MALGKKPAALIFFGILWLGAACLGLEKLLVYGAIPGEPATAPDLWPSQSRLPRISDRATLVMAAHPKCPCTRASLGELSRIIARCEGKLTVYVLFVKPAGVPEDWTDTDLWRTAASLPGITVKEDPEGAEARSFGAPTSGHTLLYDSRGRLLFSGGITGSRGHAGENDGTRAIVSFVNTGGGERASTPVFGCSLRDPAP